MKRVLIVGSGKRVRAAALPVFLSASEEFEVTGVFSRTPKHITAGSREFEVEALEALDAARLADADLIYMVVAKDAVPAVLRRIVQHAVSHVDMLIETPVLRFRLLGHLRLLDSFRNTWVTEDCTTLPFFDTIGAFLDEHGSPPLERVTFDRAAYAYHGLAMGRALLGGGRVRAGRRVRTPGGARRTVSFGPQRELVVIEPRDYTRGHVTLEAACGAISDDPTSQAPHRLAPVTEGGACVGFQIGETRTELAPQERALMGTPLAEGGVMTWMDGMKRVGFRRLLQAVAEGRGAHPLDQAIEDTVVDYQLERFGRYIPTPLTNPYSPLARLGMRALTRLTGG